jgi:hypothetical protein
MQRSNSKSSLETLESLESLRTLLFQHPFLFPVFIKTACKGTAFFAYMQIKNHFFLVFYTSVPLKSFVASGNY